MSYDIFNNGIKIGIAIMYSIINIYLLIFIYYYEFNKLLPVHLHRLYTNE